MRPQHHDTNWVGLIAAFGVSAGVIYWLIFEWPW